MKLRIALFALIGILLLTSLAAPAPAAAQTGLLVRVNNHGSLIDNLAEITNLCNPISLLGLINLKLCTVVGGLGDPLSQLFLVKPIGGGAVSTLLSSLLGVLCPANAQGLAGLTCVLDAELDQTVNVVTITLGDLIAPTNLNDTVPVSYYGTTAVEGYTAQPASTLIELSKIQAKICTPSSCGAGIVADIDTGVDPNQSVLRPSLLAGYDFTRNEAGGYETRDVNNGQPIDVTTPPTSDVRTTEFMAAVVNGGGASLLKNPAYSSFGHGTMVSGIIHLVAPTAKILPLKAFGANGQGQLSNVLRAIYYGVANGANILNMSFDLTASSPELASALTFANVQGLVAVASVGNDGKQLGTGFATYPASLSPVMAIASTSNNDTLSTFSNFGAPPVWIAAPGEAVVSTYPYNSYAAGWGTSFSAPFVSGTVALMRSARGAAVNQGAASNALCHSVNIHNLEVGYGRLDAFQALQGLGSNSCPNNY